MMKTLLLALATCALSTSALGQTFDVTGVFTYEDKGWQYSGWNGSDPAKAIRRADVSVIDDLTAAVLGTGSTGQDGSFSITCNSVGVTDIVVRVDADTGNEPTFQRVRVTTESNSEYQSLSPVFASHDTSGDLDVGTTNVLKILSNGDEANPFNILDMGVHGMEYITGPLVAESNAGQTIRFYWPSSGSFASGNQAHISEDDGYDDAVILHEMGHVVHNQYSDSDSPGGSHSFGDSDQDPRLSFGEGYATAFAGAIFDAAIDRQAIYLDANASSQNGGVQLRMRLETASPYTAGTKGAADEVAVACTLFDIVDSEVSKDQSVGSDDDALQSTTLVNGLNRHRAWWDVFAGPVGSAANLTINDAWNGWFSEHGAAGLHQDLEDIYGLLRLDYFNDDDEPNNTIGTATPVSVGSAWGGNSTLYWSAGSPPAPGFGDVDHFSFEALIGSEVDIETRYPGGSSNADTQCDTFLTLYDPSGASVVTNQSSGTGRNAAILGFTIDESGTWTYAVSSNHSYRRYGRYNGRASWVFENLAPQISVGPDAIPAAITVGQLTTLSVTASDGNPGATLTYQWTPQDGGSISGSGSSVMFTPPLVALVTVVDIDLLVTDEFGAVAPVETVSVTVSPPGPTCPAPASTTSGGLAKAGQAGVPVLAAVNLPLVPNSDFALSVTGGLPLGTAYLILGLSFLDAPFDLGKMYPSPDLILTFPLDSNGDLFLPLPQGDDPAFCGLTVWWQVMVPDDPGAAGFRQTSQTAWVQTVNGN
ncbi:MAG: hypothetical protein ACI9EF_002708 [Pseudohongiellaceae bacterium]|jgi:hypothetical protein